MISPLKKKRVRRRKKAPPYILTDFTSKWKTIKDMFSKACTGTELDQWETGEVSLGALKSCPQATKAVVSAGVLVLLHLPNQLGGEQRLHHHRGRGGVGTRG